MYTGATHAAMPTPIPIKNLFPICRRLKGLAWRGGGRVLTYHGPHVVAHRLANGTTYEDYICDTEYEPTANVVGQGTCPKRTKKSTECRSGSDQFLWEGDS